jgi:uncharacterized membrane protein
MRRRIAAWLHGLFEVSLLAKGLFSAGEALSGLALLLTHKAEIVALVNRLTWHELLQDPKDPLANYLLGLAQHLSLATQHFYALYLLSHGVLKLGVVVLLARGVRWAYPLAIVLLSGFCAYQIYLWTLEHAPMMLALTALDLLVIALTWREWRVVSGTAAAA